MDDKEKTELSKSDILTKFVTPALIDAGSDEMTQICHEVTLTSSQVIELRSSLQ